MPSVSERSPATCKIKCTLKGFEQSPKQPSDTRTNVDNYTSPFSRGARCVRPTLVQVFPCQNCSLKFGLKTELREHMSAHIHSLSQLGTREVDAVQAAVKGPGVKGLFQLSIKS